MPSPEVEKKVQELLQSPEFQDLSPSEQRLEVSDIVGKDFDPLDYPQFNPKRAEFDAAVKRHDEEAAKPGMWSKILAQDPLKTIGDAGVGAIGGSMGGLPGMAAGAAINVGLNAGEPFLNANNAMNALGPVASLGGKAIQGTRLGMQALEKAPILTSGALGALESGAVMGAGQMIDPNSMGAGTGAAIGGAMGAGGAALGKMAKNAPSLWQKLLGESENELGGMKPGDPNRIDLANQMSDDAAKKGMALAGNEAAEGQISKLQQQAGKAGTLGTQLSTRISDTDTALQMAKKKLAAAKKVLDKYKDKRLDTSLEIDDQKLAAAGDITDARKAINNTTLAGKTDLRKFVPEQEMIDREKQINDAKNKIADTELYIKSREVTEKANKTLKSESEKAAELGHTQALEEFDSINKHYATLNSALERNQLSQDVLNQEIQKATSSLDMDISKMTPEQKAFIKSAAAKSPEAFMGEILKPGRAPNAHDRTALINFMQVYGDTPEKLAATRSIALDYLTRPITSGGKEVARTGSRESANLLQHLDGLGSKTVNEFFGSPKAYDNLKSLTTYLQKSQEKFPKTANATLGWMGGGLSIGTALYAANAAMENPGLATGVGSSLIAAYAFKQRNRIIDSIIRNDGQFSKILTAAAKNPGVLAPGSATARFFNAWLANHADSVSVDGKEIPLKR